MIAVSDLSIGTNLLTESGFSVHFSVVPGRDINKAGSFKAKAKSLKAKAKARDQGYKVEFNSYGL